MDDASLNESVVMKRNHKDSVFTDLFSDPKYLLQLYQTLHPEDVETTEKDLKDVTISNVLTAGIYNDLGFRVGKKMIILMEAQSTWSENIAIRSLLYVAETYKRYVKDNNIDLYREKPVDIPKPELYVVYTGDKKEIPQAISLKASFFEGEDVCIDAVVKVFRGGKNDIISQYMEFSKVADEQIGIYGRTKKAVEETIRICKDRGVLKDYLQDKEVEIVDMMSFLFDQEEVTKISLINARKEGVEEGEKKGKEKGKIEAYVDIYRNGLITLSYLATLIGCTETQAKEYVNIYREKKEALEPAKHI